MDVLIFFITLTAQVLTTIAIVMSIARPQRRIWPPSRQRAWGQYCSLARRFDWTTRVLILLEKY